VNNALRVRDKRWCVKRRINPVIKFFAQIPKKAGKLFLRPRDEVFVEGQVDLTSSKLAKRNVVLDAPDKYMPLERCACTKHGITKLKKMILHQFVLR
jgi:hypothetical protein